jgi:hypothetical protein
MSSSRILTVKHDKLKALVIQGKALMKRGNVSMEEADAYIGLSDAVLNGIVPATLSANTAISSHDPDVKMELAVTEVAYLADATETEIGQVPPHGSVISMDDEELQEFDTLIDESEELTALSHFGTAMQNSSMADSEKSFEQFKTVVINSLKRTGVSAEDIEQVENAVDIDTVVGKVDDVRDVADSIIEEFSNSGNVITVESAEGSTTVLNHIVARARQHIARKGISK